MEEKKKKPTLEERIILFERNIVSKANGHGYSDEMIQEFTEYWTEFNEGGKKFRAETQKIFNISMRLATWFKNSQKFNPVTKSDLNDKLGTFKERYGI